MHRLCFEMAEVLIRGLFGRQFQHANSRASPWLDSRGGYRCMSSDGSLWKQPPSAVCRAKHGSFSRRAALSPLQPAREPDQKYRSDDRDEDGADQALCVNSKNA